MARGEWGLLQLVHAQQVLVSAVRRGHQQEVHSAGQVSAKWNPEGLAARRRVAPQWLQVGAWWAGWERQSRSEVGAPWVRMGGKPESVVRREQAV